jgi:SAM-dependent methyltransferase
MALRRTMRPEFRNRDFNPGLSHPLHIIRKRLLQAIVKYAPELRGRMMDFGCGTKPYQPLFSNATEYVGVDFEGEGHGHQNESIDVFYGGESLPFPDNSFDSILATEVFEHIFNLEEILDELFRVLKPGGKMLVTVPFAWHEHEMPNDFGRYTSLGLRSMLEKHGFVVTNLEKTSNFVETIFQLWGLYWYIHIFPKFPIGGGIAAPVFHFTNNVWGKLMGKLFPKKTDLFLNLVVLASKQ